MSAATRQESDRHETKGRFAALFNRPEIGPIGVMLVLFGMLGLWLVGLLAALAPAIRGTSVSPVIATRSV